MGIVPVCANVHESDTCKMNACNPAEYKAKMDLRPAGAGCLALRKMMRNSSHAAELAGAGSLSQLHKIHSKNKGRAGGERRGGRGTRKEEGEAKMEGRGVCSGLFAWG